MSKLETARLWYERNKEYVTENGDNLPWKALYYFTKTQDGLYRAILRLSDDEDEGCAQ